MSSYTNYHKSSYEKKKAEKEINRNEILTLIMSIETNIKIYEKKYNEEFLRNEKETLETLKETNKQGKFYLDRINELRNVLKKLEKAEILKIK